jgi:hypothetical protein
MPVHAAGLLGLLGLLGPLVVYRGHK